MEAGQERGVPHKTTSVTHEPSGQRVLALEQDGILAQAPAVAAHEPSEHLTAVASVCGHVTGTGHRAYEEAHEPPGQVTFVPTPSLDTCREQSATGGAALEPDDPLAGQ